METVIGAKGITRESVMDNLFDAGWYLVDGYPRDRSGDDGEITRRLFNRFATDMDYLRNGFVL